MFIKEVEEITGITAKNIRFYEKEGLLTPERNEQNQYRNYSEEDIRILKEIKLLRKFDISLQDIKNIQSGTLPLGDCMEKYILFLCERKNELAKAIELCKEIKKNESQLSNINVDFYLNKINVMEIKGMKFADIAKDFITNAKAFFPPTIQLFFEPENPITNKREFTDEIFRHANKNNLSVTILHEGMEPVIWLEGKRYYCMLGVPRMINVPFLPFFMASPFAFKWVYFYEDKYPE